jgi:phage baseplate assembly protein W
MAIGFDLPFQQSSGSDGFFVMTHDKLSAVQANIRSLLVMNWGDRPMHFRMGCNLRELLFEPMDRDELRDRAAERVNEQFGTWLPFVRLQRLNILLAEDDPSLPANGMRISLSFKMNGIPEPGQLEVVIS